MGVARATLTVHTPLVGSLLFPPTLVVLRRRVRAIRLDGLILEHRDHISYVKFETAYKRLERVRGRRGGWG